MEYVDGMSLHALIRREGSLDYRDALPLFRQLLKGLAHAHRNGIIHQNLRPTNIHLTEGGRVKISGFGPAKRQEGRDPAAAGDEDALAYLSPEHVRSTAEVDHRSDLYAAAMVMYEALTGRTPFQSDETAFIIMRAIVEEPFVPPTQFAQGLPQEVSGVVMKALSKNPEDRYQSADEMLAALEAFERQVGSAEPGGPVEAPAGSTKRVRAWSVYGLVGIAFAVTVGLAWWIVRDALAPSSTAADAAVGQVQTVTLQPGFYERILSSVVPATRRSGVLVLRAVPYGHITVDDRELGDDSLEATVASGRRRIEVEHPLYGKKHKIVEVGSGQRKEVICYFEGLVRVQANNEAGLPLQAELFVNEQGTGRMTPVDEPYALAPGLYMMETYLEDYVGGVTYVEVRSAANDSLLAAPPVETLEFALREIKP